MSQTFDNYYKKSVINVVGEGGGNAYREIIKTVATQCGKCYKVIEKNYICCDFTPHLGVTTLIEVTLTPRATKSNFPSTEPTLSIFPEKSKLYFNGLLGYIVNKQKSEINAHCPITSDSFQH